MSRFVPASASASTDPTDRDGEWAQAREEVETRQRVSAEMGMQSGGKSLYETLQANKAAKQEQFEEAIRLKNQFRSLDEDEVEFLDSVLESTRAKEAEVKRETRDQLEAFRQQQEEAERSARIAGPSEPSASVETSWVVGPRKKRKAKDDILMGAKLRKTSSAEKSASANNAPAKPTLAPVSPDTEPHPSELSKETKVTKAVTPALQKSSSSTVSSKSPPPAVGLGLGSYSSDESD